MVGKGAMERRDLRAGRGDMAGGGEKTGRVMRAICCDVFRPRQVSRLCGIYHLSISLYCVQQYISTACITAIQHASPDSSVSHASLSAGPTNFPYPLPCYRSPHAPSISTFTFAASRYMLYGHRRNPTKHKPKKYITVPTATHW